MHELLQVSTLAKRAKVHFHSLGTHKPFQTGWRNPVAAKPCQLTGKLNSQESLLEFIRSLFAAQSACGANPVPSSEAPSFSLRPLPDCSAVAESVAGDAEGVRVWRNCW